MQSWGWSGRCLLLRGGRDFASVAAYMDFLRRLLAHEYAYSSMQRNTDLFKVFIAQDTSATWLFRDHNLQELQEKTLRYMMAAALKDSSAKEHFATFLPMFAGGNPAFQPVLRDWKKANSLK
jgi:hypothetical protein